mmetsp:Transcript_114365/g.364569  ORF Transcript_114365/g.364569 Transcript_114365/m.364569 type:complete len:604 (-) Transcript_114365:67-1878(-)
MDRAAGAAPDAGTAHGGAVSSGGTTWHAQRVAVYRSGRAEVALSDGSGLIVHPRVKHVSYFRQDGGRQRLLTACVPRCCTLGADDGEGGLCREDDLQSKVLAAIALRNYFHPEPLAAPGLPGPRMWRHIRASRVSWPGPGTWQVGCAKAPDVRVASTDGSASLVLSPHGLTYTVEWWLPISEPALVSANRRGRGLARDAADRPLPGQRLFAVNDCAVGVYHEHLHQEQHFAVLDPPAAAWVYPLLLALSEHREAAAEPDSELLDARLAELARLLRDHVASGLIAEEGDGVVSASLPRSSTAKTAVPTRLEAWTSDTVSPASALGAAGEGAVHVLWAPDSTTWLHPGPGCEGEATVDACGDGAQSHVITSAQQGRFWTHSHAGHRDVLCVDVLPADGAGIQLSRWVLEAVRWLRFNRAELGLGRGGADDGEGRPLYVGSAPCQHPGAHSAELGVQTLPESAAAEQSGGWVPERDQAEEGVGSITVFRPAGSAPVLNERRLVRILFRDAVRLQCTLRADSRGVLAMPVASDPFRLLDRGGRVLTRSFGEPLGCEAYADVARRFIRRVAADPAEVQKSMEANTLLADQERRRDVLLLQLRGLVGVS